MPAATQGMLAGRANEHDDSAFEAFKNVIKGEECQSIDPGQVLLERKLISRHVA